MNDETNVNSEMPEQEGQQQANQSAPQGDAGWQEVGQQFQALGASIAQAVRTAWEDEQTQRQLKEMRTGLEAMVKDVSKAIEDSANTPKGKQIREEAGRTVEAVQHAGKQTVQEVRPHLVQALQQLNEELQKLINRMEKKETPKPQDPEVPGE
jgi:hypothetical protein